MFAANGSGDGTSSDSASATTAADLVCGRTSAIADAITAAARVATCKKVTAAQLGEITSLDASDESMTSLAGGDLSGLSSLTTLDLSGNAFTSIPSGLFAVPANLENLDLSSALASVPESNLSGLFANLPLTTLDLGSNGWSVLPEGILTGLSNLATLDLGGNTVDPLPVIVTLERVARAEFKAAIPAGAPFAAAVPVTVRGGTLDGTPATVTVGAGQRESTSTRTVTPSDPRTGPVEVTVGTLPAIPSGHSGYVLKASDDLPLTVVSAPATVTIEAETGQVLANAWDYADFTLRRSPVSGSIEVEVEVTESDTFVIGHSLGTNTVTFEDGVATKTLSLGLTRNPSGDGTITATVQAGDDNTVGTPASATVNVVDINPAMDVVFRDDTITVEEGTNLIVHVVGTTEAGVDRPSMDRPIGITVSTRKSEADPDDGDYTTLSDELLFAYEDFTQNADGRWVGTITAEIITYDDTEYEGTEQFSAKLEGTAALPGTITVNGALVPREDFVTLLLTDNEPPPPPTRILTTAIGATVVELQWDDAEIADGDEITGYKIEWSLTGGDPWEVATDLVEFVSTSFDQGMTHHGLNPNTTYFHRLSTTNAHGSGTPSELQSATTNDEVVCARTPQVRDWIVGKVTGTSTCRDITEGQLSRLAGEMDLSNAQITELRPGDFDGLIRVSRLILQGNELTTLPDGVFDEMTALRDIYLSENRLSNLPPNIFRNIVALRVVDINNNQLENLPEAMLAGRDLFQLSASDNPFSTLGSGTFAGASIEFIDLSPGNLTSLPADIFAPLRNSLSLLYAENNNLTDLPDGLLEGLSLSELILYGNPGAPFQIEVTLESDGGNEVRVSVPIGAPTNFDVPVTATNGTIDGTSTKTISVDRGAVASAPIIVERTAGSTAPVSATLGAISVTIPDDHSGYAFALSTQTTFEVMAQASVVSAPTDLTAQPDGPNEIVLAWTAPEDDPTAPITGYRIEVSTDGDTWTVAVTNTASTDTTYMHARRVAGTTYHYRVSAVNVAGAGRGLERCQRDDHGTDRRVRPQPLGSHRDRGRATATDCTLVTCKPARRHHRDRPRERTRPVRSCQATSEACPGSPRSTLGWGLSAVPADLLAGLTSLTSFSAGERVDHDATGRVCSPGAAHLTTVDLAEQPDHGACPNGTLRRTLPGRSSRRDTGPESP